MTPDEFAAALNGGKPIKVTVTGWVVGSEMRQGFYTDHTAGLPRWERHGEPSIVAEVRFDSAEVQNVDRSFAGTRLTIEKHGGGTLRIPIELLSVAEGDSDAG